MVMSVLRRWGGERAEQTALCRGGCGMSPHLADLVFVNHCFHGDEKNRYRHRHCAGMRILCRACHERIGTLAYYEAQLRDEAERFPDKYPWDECIIGLRIYMSHLNALVERGVNPASEDEIALTW